MNYKDAQRQTREALEPRFYPGKSGEHPFQVGRSITLVNRQTARQRAVSRDYTKPNIEYRSKREKYPFKGHAVNAAHQAEKKVGTNHERHLARRAA